MLFVKFFVIVKGYYLVLAYFVEFVFFTAFSYGDWYRKNDIMKLMCDKTVRQCTLIMHFILFSVVVFSASYVADYR